MPTPRNSTDDLPLELESRIDRTLHQLCPPENSIPAQWRSEVLEQLEGAAVDNNSTASSQTGLRQLATLDPTEMTNPVDELDQATTTKQVPSANLIEVSPPSPRASPSISTVEDKGAEHTPSPLSTSSALKLHYSARYGVDSQRLIQIHTSSFLRPGSQFRGTQQSENTKYSVEVEIKTVDMSESFICGYLKIEGLTPEHATLTTFFEGEIIGSKYTFQTRHSDWGASDKEDLKHWNRFTAWRPLAKQSRKADFHYKNSTNKENMFMRWKEKFLVPDHRVREINGASFEGFYYICFNQAVGTISGIYYHANAANSSSHRLQQLELRWVNDHGCFGAMEFR